MVQIQKHICIYHIHANNMHFTVILLWRQSTKMHAYSLVFVSRTVVGSGRLRSGGGTVVINYNQLTMWNRCISHFIFKGKIINRSIFQPNIK